MTPQAKTNKFFNFISGFLELPLWIKEAIYINLHNSLKEKVKENYLINLKKDDLFQFCISKITFRGQKELENREKNLQLQLYKFLQDVDEGLSIIEITINNFWTLEECARYYADCIDHELISLPKSNKVLGTAQFLCGKIRMGEYFLHLEKITIDDLNEALRNQQQIVESTGDRIGIAGILMNMGVISENDIQEILCIKEEAKKRFIFNLTVDAFSSSSPETEADQSNLKNQNARLLKENTLLKDQLRKILNIQKKK